MPGKWSAKSACRTKNPATIRMIGPSVRRTASHTRISVAQAAKRSTSDIITWRSAQPSSVAT